MIENLPSFITITFVVTTLVTLVLFYWTIHSSSKDATRKKANSILFGMMIWLLIQAVLSFNNFYNSNVDLFPPKIALFGVLPLIITIVLLFAKAKGREFIDSLPLVNIIYLNVVRIPVEIVLFWLFLYKAVPELMTFTGRNFDIIAGITASFIAYYGCTKVLLSRKVILIWNLICLALLINIVVIAILSIPSPMQKFGFDQPNIAVLNFPFSWLPTFIVPIVFFGHLVSIRQLLKK
ncbi:MAG TPA: hypothetical protein VFS71_06465 [Flavobacterium sp.]|uniref:hypothetical protein n=1 Tax=Flavobacterium sp. TaxID=239 RepID=UPI002DB9B217|nr:hypothetical protein [Flavobacterium sp.]HEU4789308.1 hypothetical protein [Flavobacterium sp.]